MEDTHIDITPEPKEQDTSVKETATDILGDEHIKISNTGVKALALVGFVFILSFFVWGAIQIIPSGENAVTSAVSSVISVPNFKKDEGILFTFPTHNVQSGRNFPLTWTHKTSGEGVYLFEYACVENVGIEIKSKAGDTIKVACGKPLNIGDVKVFEFTIFSTEKRFVDVPMSIMFLPDDASLAITQASTFLTVSNKNPTGGKTIENTESTVVPARGSAVGGKKSSTQRGIKTTETRVIESGKTGGSVGTAIKPSFQTGVPDLSVTIMATGVVDKSSNTLTPKALVGQNDRAGIRFEVKNIGTKASGAWTFIVDLPLSTGTYVFRPKEQQASLNPNERTEYTLGFDGITRSKDKAEVIINIDTAREVPETNRKNNTAKVTMPIQ